MAVPDQPGAVLKPLVGFGHSDLPVDLPVSSKERYPLGFAPKAIDVELLIWEQNVHPSFRVFLIPASPRIGHTAPSPLTGPANGNRLDP